MSEEVAVLYADGALGLAVLLVWVYALLDVITVDAAAARNLPKAAWVLIVLLFGAFFVGPLLWFVAGRPARATRPRGPQGDARIPAAYDRPEPTTATNPDDDAAFMQSLRARADEQRQRAEQERRRRLESGDS